MVWIHRHAVDVPVLALEVDSLSRPGLQQHGDAFFHARSALLLGNAVAVELQRPIATSQSNDQASSAEDVDRSSLLRQPQWVVEGNDVDSDANFDAPSASGEGSQQNARRRRQSVIGVVMLGEPDGVETERLGEHHLVDFLRQDIDARAARRSLQEEIGPEAHYLGTMLSPRY